LDADVVEYYYLFSIYSSNVKFMHGIDKHLFCVHRISMDPSSIEPLIRLTDKVRT
jgi:hypothetical protein